jgi:uncharacterized membrane protein (DUF373 family)
MTRFLKALNYAVLGIEVLVTVALVVLAGGVLLFLGGEMLSAAVGGGLATKGNFIHIVGLILEVFILVELFRIAIAYMKHENVIPTVLEAALVAVARKFVVFEGSDDYLRTALGMASLLLAVAVSWWMLARSNACELHEPA